MNYWMIAFIALYIAGFLLTFLAGMLNLVENPLSPYFTAWRGWGLWKRLRVTLIIGAVSTLWPIEQALKIYQTRRYYLREQDKLRGTGLLSLPPSENSFGSRAIVTALKKAELRKNEKGGVE